MILAENRNFINSLMFYLTLRETLKEFIDISDVNKKEKLKDFITNEATDYEILTLAINGELPKEKYDLANEHLLLSNLKESILENFEVISEIIDPSVIKSFIFEVAPLFPDYSSNKSIAEFTISKNKGEILEEGIHDKLLDLGKKIDALSHKIKIAKASKGAVGARKMKDIGTKTHMTGRAIASRGGQPMPDIMPKDAAGNLTRWQKELSKLKGMKAGLLKRAKETGEQAKTGTYNALKTIGDKFGSSAIGKEISKRTGKEVGGAGVGAGVALGAAVVSSLLLYGAVKTYKRFFSQAAKECKGKSGREKTICMNNARIKAMQAQLGDLQKAKTACAKSKNPTKCVKTVTANIAKIQNKIKKLQSK
jgi:hypothetical protein